MLDIRNFYFIYSVRTCQMIEKLVKPFWPLFTFFLLKSIFIYFFIFLIYFFYPHFSIRVFPSAIRIRHPQPSRPVLQTPVLQHPAWDHCAGKPIESVVYRLNNIKQTPQAMRINVIINKGILCWCNIKLAPGLASNN